MFVSADDPNLKGNVAELKIAAEAARLGIPVLRPMTEHERYDLVFELGGGFKRVQCKWAPLQRRRRRVSGCMTNRRGPSGFIRTTYTAEEIDAIAAYCPELDECYLLPDRGDRGHAARSICASSRPEMASGPRLNWAADYELSGL